MSEHEELAVYQLPIEWYFPEDIISRYAMNLVVQHSEHEFIISFFEVERPLVFGPPEQVGARLKEIKSVRAKCVARIIVAAERMPEFVRVLQANLDSYLAKKSEQGNEHHESTVRT